MGTRRNTTGQAASSEGNVSRETQVREVSYKFLMGLLAQGFVTYSNNEAVLTITKPIVIPADPPQEGDTEEQLAMRHPEYTEMYTEELAISRLVDLTKHQTARITAAVNPASEALKLIKKLKEQGLTSEQIAQMAQG